MQLYQILDTFWGMEGRARYTNRVMKQFRQFIYMFGNKHLLEINIHALIHLSAQYPLVSLTIYRLKKRFYFIKQNM